MYAIIATGGKQYKVAEGDIIKVEKLGVEAGETYTFDQVLAVNNDKLVVGTPTVEGATVTASVIGDGKGKEKSSFTSIREKLDTIRKTDTDSSTQLLRSRRSTLNCVRMIKVTIYKTSRQEYTGFDMSGHAGYDDPERISYVRRSRRS